MTARTTTSQTGYCVSCQWWNESYRDDKGNQACGLIGTWLDADESDLAFIDYDVASLMTKPDFGCVQWAARNEEADARKDQGGSA